LTVIVNVCAGPGQSTDPLLKEGVTVIVADIGAVPVFVAVNAKGPVPSVPRPMAVLLFVQEKVVVPPVLAVVNETVCDDPLHIIISAIVYLTFRITVMLMTGSSGQFVPPLLNVGVTVIVPVIGEVPELVAVKEIFPLPVA
jgi:hypothetical protein